MVGQALENTMEERRDILHSICIFEEKYELLCQSQFHIIFKVSLVGDQGTKWKQEGGSFSSTGTKYNPIDLDFDSPVPTIIQ